jgi:hypothetical protein
MEYSVYETNNKFLIQSRKFWVAAHKTEATHIYSKLASISNETGISMRKP